MPVHMLSSFRFWVQRVLHGSPVFFFARFATAAQMLRSIISEYLANHVSSLLVALLLVSQCFLLVSSVLLAMSGFGEKKVARSRSFSLANLSYDFIQPFW
jgi:hypothetical protein